MVEESAMTAVVENEVQDNNELRYAVFANGEWGVDMVGTEAADGSDIDHAGVFGYPITKFTMGGVEKYRVFTRKHKWSKFFTKYDKNNPAGDGTDILAIEIYGKGVIIGVHVKGGSWLPVKMGTFDGDTDKPTYAGCMTAIDGLWVDR